MLYEPLGHYFAGGLYNEDHCRYLQNYVNRVKILLVGLALYSLTNSVDQNKYNNGRVKM